MIASAEVIGCGHQSDEAGIRSTADRTDYGLALIDREVVRPFVNDAPLVNKKIRPK